MSKLMVIVTSGGKNWIGSTPEQDGKTDGVQIIQIPVYTDEIIPKDSAGQLPPLDGRHQETKKAILELEGVGKWLKAKEVEISTRIVELWSKNGLKEDTIVHVAVRCQNGHRQSVVFAESIFDQLQYFWKIDIEKLNECPWCTFVLQHLTLPTAQIAKGWIQGDDRLLTPFLKPITQVKKY